MGIKTQMHKTPNLCPRFIESGWVLLNLKKKNVFLGGGNILQEHDWPVKHLIVQTL